MKRQMLYLLAATFLGCGSDKPDEMRPSLDNISQVGLGEYDSSRVKDSLKSLVTHCHEFNDNSKWASEYETDCGIVIPETKETDDLISGKGRVNGYNPETIPSGEGFMTISHKPGKTPEIILNGSKITGKSSSCYLDTCLDPVIKHIRSVDSRNGNHLFENVVNFYAREVSERYTHGIKLR
ncbi:hypothetical protein HQ489_06235 [Candidatus Woesearchaeota archaeon]|nr:hypothetical protein [Candidatus Woesearchaeota archaeon]